MRLEAALDRTGVVYDDGTIYTMLVQNVIVAGDDVNNHAIRGMVSIVLASIPAGATIDSATLKVLGYVPFGTPYAEFGNVVIDHIDIGASFNASDFSGGTLTATYLTVPQVAATNTPGELVGLDVRSAILADVAAGRPTSSFRFQFNLAPSIDAGPDMFWLNADQGVPLTLPHVIVTYH